MSGHNKWSQIKHQKGAKDAKKSAVFTKVLGAIAIAAKADPSPDTNPRLRTLIEKARAAGVPNENITRAINRAKEQKDLKEFVFECVGPEGSLLVVEGVTDSSNRTMQQLRTVAADAGLKPADPGSTLWAFDIVDEQVDGVPTRHHKAKFPQPLSPDATQALLEAIALLEEHEDVLRVNTNATNHL
jgi:transcriptional/translational regulatory protein YebC/TACO1